MAHMCWIRKKSLLFYSLRWRFIYQHVEGGLDVEGECFFDVEIQIHLPTSTYSPSKNLQQR